MPATETPSLVRINAQTLFPGSGEPLEEASVLFGQGVIQQVGPRSGVSSDRPAETYEVPYLLPGLWDSHVHFWGATEASSLYRAYTAPALAGARSVRDAQTLLAEGVTSVRCLGGFGIEIGAAIAEGSAVGPRVYGAGAMLSIPGGHGDPGLLPTWPTRETSLTRRICSGLDDCVLAVREQIRRGAKVIKMCVSGGVMSEADVSEQQFSDDEIRAIVGEAARSRRPVAAHAHGSAGILAAVRAGVTTIEHGSQLTEEAAKEMAKRGTVLVPTRSILENAANRTDLSPSALHRAASLAKDNLEAIRMALHYGVTIASGSDLGVSGSSGSHSFVKARTEIASLVRAGMGPLEALEAATAHGPKTLGPLAPSSGRIESGYTADLVGIDFDPLSDPDAWASPGRVTHVWKDGELSIGQANSPLS